VRTTVAIGATVRPRQIAELRALAEARDVSVSRLLREAIDRFLSKEAAGCPHEDHPPREGNQGRAENGTAPVKGGPGSHEAPPGYGGSP